MEDLKTLIKRIAKLEREIEKEDRVLLKDIASSDKFYSCAYPYMLVKMSDIKKKFPELVGLSKSRLYGKLADDPEIQKYLNEQISILGKSAKDKESSIFEQRIKQHAKLKTLEALEARAAKLKIKLDY